jgi:hypothetical protein
MPEQTALFSSARTEAWLIQRDLARDHEVPLYAEKPRKIATVIIDQIENEGNSPLFGGFAKWPPGYGSDIRKTPAAAATWSTDTPAKSAR